MVNKTIQDFDPKAMPGNDDEILIQQADGTTLRATLGSIHAAKVGFFDYNDNATQSAPINITGGGGFVDLTNDELGAFTNKSFPPNNVTDVWDADLNTFDWSELTAGDTVDIRLDAVLTTTLNNTAIEVELFLGLGGGLYSIPFITGQDFKAAGTYPLNTFNGIYLGDSNTLDNGGVFKISADKDCSLVVNGWYCRIIRR